MGLSVALVHYPVKDKQGFTVATSITNFDIHDIARSCATFGIYRYFVVNPVPSQQWLAEKIIKHWTTGFGAEYNTTRKHAVSNVELVSDMEDVYDKLTEYTGREPVFVATSAKKQPNCKTFEEMRRIIAEDKEEICLVFGTGWGIHPSLLQDMDYALEPITGAGAYNHLSVRSAVAIILDRLISR